MKNPTGDLFMNMGGWSVQQIISYLQRSEFMTVAFLDMNREAGEVQAATGIPYVVSRLYAFEPHANTHDVGKIKQYAAQVYRDLQNLRADAQNPNVLFQVNNEQGFREDDFRMYTELVNLAMQDPAGPVGMVFGNVASGSIMTGFWDQPNQWEAQWAIDFFIKMHQYRNVALPNGAKAFLLGDHTYTSQYPLIAVNGGEWRKNGAYWNRIGADNLWQLHDAFGVENALDWSKPQDHVGRTFQGIMKALNWYWDDPQKRWIPGENAIRDGNGIAVYAPNMIATESGFDSMNDVRFVHWDELVIMSAQATDIDQIAVRSLQYAQSVLGDTPTIGYQQPMLPSSYTALGLDTPRGYKSLEKTWQKEDWFPGDMAVGEKFSQCQGWMYNRILHLTGVYVGQITFTNGDTSGPNRWWESFDNSDDDSYHEAQVEEVYKISPHAWHINDVRNSLYENVAPEPEPEPGDPQYVDIEQFQTLEAAFDNLDTALTAFKAEVLEEFEGLADVEWVKTYVATSRKNFLRSLIDWLTNWVN